MPFHYRVCNNVAFDFDKVLTMKRCSKLPFFSLIFVAVKTTNLKANLSFNMKELYHVYLGL